MSLALAMIDPAQIAQSEEAPPAPHVRAPDSGLPPPVPPPQAAHMPPPSPLPPPVPGPRFSPSGRMIDPAVTQSERNYAIILHLTIFAAAVAPFLSLIAPIVMWQLKKDESAWLNDHGREAVNFHLTILLYGVISTFLIMIVIGIPLMVGVFVLGIVGAILSAVSANRGEYYRYPMCLRFLK